MGLTDRQKEYHAYLKSPEWKVKNRKVRARAAAMCEHPGCVCLGDEVHHLTYERVFNERLEDLILLCRRHHAEAHGLFKSMGQMEAELEEWLSPLPAELLPHNAAFRVTRPDDLPVAAIVEVVDVESDTGSDPEWERVRAELLEVANK